jgi:hypothetical protein
VLARMMAWPLLTQSSPKNVATILLSSAIMVGGIVG